MKSAFQKLRDKCTVIGECWEYSASQASISNARRVMYEGSNSFTEKPIRAKCGNSACINPAHLRTSSRAQIGIENLGYGPRSVWFAPRQAIHND